MFWEFSLQETALPPRGAKSPRNAFLHEFTHGTASNDPLDFLKLVELWT